MLVWQSTYDKLLMEHMTLKHQHSNLIVRWNALIKKINARGGQQFLESGPPKGFTKEEILSLIKLCHPDKHGGNALATQLTQKLLQLR